MKVWAQVLLIGCMLTLLSAGSAKQVRADMLTTLFAENNGQAVNMFDFNVLAAQGIIVSAFDLNLQVGTWDINLYTLDGLYAGNQTNSAAWTLHASITGLVSNGLDVPTNWDFADLSLNAGDQAFYVEVTNGFGMVYTNGTAEGAIIT